MRKIGQDPSSTYYNANYIAGADGNPKYYVAAMGPLEKCVKNFWRAVWTDKCPTIVMLTELEEDGVSKCERYWPKMDGTGTPVEYAGGFSIRNVEVIKRKGYVKSMLKVTRKGEERSITHFWYNSWPDHGVPRDATNKMYPGAILGLLKEINIDRIAASAAGNTGPTMVHCSAGIGRTGTVIAIEHGIQHLHTSGRCDPIKIVETIRQCRCNMVQHGEQFLFVQMALVKYCLRQNRTPRIIKPGAETKIAPSAAAEPTKMRSKEFTAQEISRFSVAELCQWLAMRGIGEEQQEAMRDEGLCGKDFARMCCDDDGLAELVDLGLPGNLIDEAATLLGRSRQPSTRANHGPADQPEENVPPTLTAKNGAGFNSAATGPRTFNQKKLAKWLIKIGASEDAAEALEDEGVNGVKFAEMLETDDGRAELLDYGLDKEMMDMMVHKEVFAAAPASAPVAQTFATFKATAPPPSNSGGAVASSQPSRGHRFPNSSDSGSQRASDAALKQQEPEWLPMFKIVKASAKSGPASWTTLARGSFKLPPRSARKAVSPGGGDDDLLDEEAIAAVEGTVKEPPPPPAVKPPTPPPIEEVDLFLSISAVERALEGKELTSVDYMHRVMSRVTMALQSLYKAAVADGVPKLKICLDRGEKYGTVLPSRPSKLQQNPGVLPVDASAEQARIWKQAKDATKATKLAAKRAKDAADREAKVATDAAERTLKIERFVHEQWGFSFRILPGIGMVLHQIQQGTAASRYPQLQPGVNIRLINAQPTLTTKQEDLMKLLTFERNLTLELGSTKIPQRGGMLTVTRPSTNVPWGFAVARHPSGKGVIFNDPGRTPCPLFRRYPRLEGTDILEINGVNALKTQISTLVGVVGANTLLTLVMAENKTTNTTIVTLMRKTNERWGLHIGKDTAGGLAVLKTFGQLCQTHPNLLRGVPLLEINGKPTSSLTLLEAREMLAATDALSFVIDPRPRARVEMEEDDSADSSESEASDEDDIDLDGIGDETDEDDIDAYYYLQPHRADLVHLVQHMQMHKNYYCTAMGLSEAAVNAQIGWLNRTRQDLAQNDTEIITAERLTGAFSFAEGLMQSADLPSASTSLAHMKDPYGLATMLASAATYNAYGQPFAPPPVPATANPDGADDPVVPVHSGGMEFRSLQGVGRLDKNANAKFGTGKLGSTVMDRMDHNSDGQIGVTGHTRDGSLQRGGQSWIKSTGGNQRPNLTGAALETFEANFSGANGSSGGRRVMQRAIGGSSVAGSIASQYSGFDAVTEGEESLLKGMDTKLEKVAVMNRIAARQVVAAVTTATRKIRSAETVALQNEVKALKAELETVGSFRTEISSLKDAVRDQVAGLRNMAVGGWVSATEIAALRAERDTNLADLRSALLAPVAPHGPIAGPAMSTGIGAVALLRGDAAAVPRKGSHDDSVASGPIGIDDSGDIDFADTNTTTTADATAGPAIELSPEEQGAGDEATLDFAWFGPEAPVSSREDEDQYGGFSLQKLIEAEVVDEGLMENETYRHLIEQAVREAGPEPPDEAAAAATAKADAAVALEHAMFTNANYDPMVFEITSPTQPSEAETTKAEREATAKLNAELEAISDELKRSSTVDVGDPGVEVIGAGNAEVNGVYARIGDHKGKTRYRKLGAGAPQKVTLQRRHGEPWGLALTTRAGLRGAIAIKKVLENSVASQCSTIKPPMTLLEVNGFKTSDAADHVMIADVMKSENIIHLVVGGGNFDGWFELDGRPVEITWDWDFDANKEADAWPNQVDYLGYWIGLKGGFNGTDENMYYNPNNVADVPEIGWETTAKGLDPPPRIAYLKDLVVQTSKLSAQPVDGYPTEPGSIDLRNLTVDGLFDWLAECGVGETSADMLRDEDVDGAKLSKMLISEDGQSELQRDFMIDTELVDLIIEAFRQATASAMQKSAEESGEVLDVRKFDPRELNEWLQVRHVSTSVAKRLLNENVDGKEMSAMLGTEDGRAELQHDFAIDRDVVLKIIDDFRASAAAAVEGMAFGTNVDLAKLDATELCERLALQGVTVGATDALRAENITGEAFTEMVTTEHGRSELQHDFGFAKESLHQIIDAPRKLIRSAELWKKPIVIKRQPGEKYGMALRLAPEGPTIVRIAAGLAVSRISRLKTGTIILKMQGIDVTKMEIADIKQIMADSGEQLSLEISLPQEPESPNEDQSITILLKKAPNEKWGLSIKADVDGPVVSKVNPTGAASRAPLLVAGARLLKLSGKDVTQSSVQEIAAVVKMAGNELELEIGLGPGSGPANPVIVIIKRDNEKWGMGVKADPGGPIISRISTDAAASQDSRLKVGRRLLTVGGVDVTVMTGPEIAQQMRIAGNELHMQLVPMDVTDFSVADIFSVMETSTSELERELAEEIEPVVASGITITKKASEKWGWKWSEGVTGPTIRKIKRGSAVSKYPEIQLGMRLAMLDGEDMSGRSMTDVSAILERSADTITVELVDDSKPPPRWAPTVAPTVAPTLVGAGNDTLPSDGDGVPIQPKPATDQLSAATPTPAPSAAVQITVPAAAEVVPWPDQNHTIEEGARVQVRGCLGTVRFVGPHKESGKPRIGVELDEPVGKHNGNVGGHVYFRCSNNHGVLPAPSKIMLITPPPEGYEGEFAITKEEAQKWGMSVQADGLGGPIIKRVKEGSVAEKHPKLKVGRRILKLNGDTVTHLATSDVVAALRASGNELRIQLESKQEEAAPQAAVVPAKTENESASDAVTDPGGKPPGSKNAPPDVAKAGDTKPKRQRKAKKGISIKKSAGEKWGMSFGVDKQGPYINKIKETGVARAQSSELQRGCRVCKLGGKDVAKASSEQLSTIFKAAGNKLTIELSAAPKKVFPVVIKMQKTQEEKWGLSLSMHAEGGPYVTKIKPDMHASRYPKLLVGMRVALMNGTDVSNCEKEDVSKLLKAGKNKMTLVMLPE